MTIGLQLSNGNPDGTSLGQSTSDLISFYNVAAVAQGAAVTTVTTTASTTTTPYGYTSTQADAIVTAVNAIISRLQTVGLIA